MLEIGGSKPFISSFDLHVYIIGTKFHSTSEQVTKVL